ncbi:MAG: methylated-DNA--[protein]-cysteine S-methyltransferase [Deltaproteobacteria bacterium]|nr:methylated-DNA--[protein]-cysteine S-methyltransferase [Deltaproteobacteria bacterium]
MVKCTVFGSSLGWCGLVGASDGIVKVFIAVPEEAQVMAEIVRCFPGSVSDDDWFRQEVCELTDYLCGKKTKFSFGLDYGAATLFQRRVWREASAIPYGCTKSYGWLARKAGRPGAARAVGTALGRNPFPVVVPCHRVVPAGGGLGGFSAPGGVALKKKLLQLEGALRR